MIKAIDNILQDSELSISVLKVLAENSFDSILITDATQRTRIVYANKAFKSLTGYDPADVIGKSPKFLQGPATDKKVTSRLVTAMKKNGRFDGKAINYKKDGTPFIMHWRVLPVKSGRKITAWVAIQRETYGV